MDVKGTKSETNLRAALSGESMARNKYTYFAMAARKEGLEDVAQAFERMAKNEMMHAKFWFEYLYGEPKDTLSNLKNAAQGEFSEWRSMYPSFAKQAREDGLEELAVMFEHVAAIERDHERQFMELCMKLTTGAKGGQQAEMPPAKNEKPGYRCMFCGATYEERPDVCTVCHAIGSFENCTFVE